MDTIDRQKIEVQLKKIGELLTHSDTTLPNLIQGNCGSSLFFAYYFLHSRNQSHQSKSLEFLEKAIYVTKTQNQTSSFGTGFTGLAWLIKELINIGVIDSNTDVLGDIDTFITKSLMKDLIDHNYDLFYGYIGKGLYYLQDYSINYYTSLRFIVETIKKDAIHDSSGIKWNSFQCEEINLGLAHGTPSVVYILLKFFSLGILKEDEKVFIEKGVEFILSQEKENGISCFSNVLGNDNVQNCESRLGWCYGDLGISYILLIAGKLFSNKEWTNKGLKIALHSCRRDLQTGYLMYDNSKRYYDTGFCHGLAGIAFIYKKLYSLTQNAELKSRMSFWLDQTISNLSIQLQSFDKSFFSIEDMIVQRNLDLIEGIPGVGLVLLSFLNQDSTGWDKIFLLDIDSQSNDKSL